MCFGNIQALKKYLSLEKAKALEKLSPIETVPNFRQIYIYYELMGSKAAAPNYFLTEPDGRVSTF